MSLNSTLTESTEEYVIQRRFNDFYNTHHNLLKTYPYLILPNIPGKFQHKDVEYRRFTFQQYLNKILTITNW